MKDNNANNTNVIPNLVRNLKKNKMLKQVQHDDMTVVQNDATTCAPLVGTLISKGGKNALVYNQEPSPEFVSKVEWATHKHSNKNRLDCFASARNDRGRHPEGTRAEDVRREPYPFNASVKNPKDLQTQNHVITRNNIEQEVLKSVRSDVVIHNKLGNGKTCLGLLRRFVHKITNNNEISPHNDMNNKNRNGLINLSTYRLIDFKEILRLKPQDDVKTLVPECPSALMPLKKKVAFTLAETLITLGIIGIVAAMTIPTLITNYQKESTVTRLKKAIAVINQAYKQSFDDVGEPDSAFDMEAEEYFKQYWAPYIKVLTYCSNPQVCGYDSNNPFTTPRKVSANTTLVSKTWRTTFYTMDGFLYIIMTAGGNPKAPSFDVLVDINGGAKPNRFGRDVFKLVRVPDGGGVQPFGYDRTNDDVDRICADTGWTCAEKIRRAGWRIEKDYPWN